MYDALLGGKDNYAADRALAGALTAADPGIPVRARENRAFLLAAVRRAAEAGIGQFLDLGCGLPRPAGENLHDAARAVNPDARVCYVDIDPVVVLHAAALTGGDGLVPVLADLRDPEAVLSVAGLDGPVCIILGAVAHFYEPAVIRQACAGYAAAMPPGSWLVISAACYRDEALLGRVMAVSGVATFRSVAVEDFRSFFAGLEPVHPGVTCARRWCSRIAGPPAETGAYMLAGAARKP